MKKPLTAKEEQVMQILWKLKKAVISDIRKELPPPIPPHTTVASTVQKLVKMGMVKFETYGKTYVYQPVLKKSTYRKFTLRRLLENYFGGSPEQVLSYFVKEEQLDPDTIRELLKDLDND